MNHHHRFDPHRRSTGLAPQIPTDGTAVPREGPLRIVAWVDRYMPYPGSLAGGERALHGLLRWLAGRGHEVSVVSPVVPAGDPELTYEGVALYPETEVDWLLGERCDVLLSQLGYTKITRAAAITAQIPYVYLFHNDFTIPHWRLHPDQVTAAVYNTNWIRESILGRHPQWARVPTATVRPPVTVGDFTVDTPGCDREFVTLVNPNQAKGGPIFYQLAEQRPGARFLAVEGAYGQQMRPKDRHRNVVWQRQTPDMRGEVYARTRVLVVPSEYESFGCVAVEAAAAGCAVVASQTRGLAEALGSAARFAPMLRGRRAAAPWLAHLDALDDPEIYDATVRALVERAKMLEASSHTELTALETTLRFAANAKRVGSGAMAPRYDPHRRHAHSVEVAPVPPVEPPGPVPVAEGAGEADRALQAGVTDPEALRAAEDMDKAATREAPGTGVAMEAVGVPADGTWSDTIEGDGSGEALPPVDMDTQQGAGTDGSASGGDAGSVPSGAVDPGDGADSQDVGRTEPEPAPARQGEGGPVAQHAGSPDPAAGDGMPYLVGQVPANATGDGGVVAWIDAGRTPAEMYDRAEAAEWVEDQRPKAGRKKRKAVMEAIGPILYEDDGG